MNLFDLYAKISIDDSGYRTKLEESRSSFADFGAKLKTGAAALGKAVAVGFTAAATAVTALAGAATASYAEYEQLVGGVETLYGQAVESVEEYAQKHNISLQQAQGAWEQYSQRQEAVMENAANAYKTAGLSVNEYMDTVNGFAASLTASLGEYEWQAASYADMIVTDMADNANKMGTNLESIQNAYAGFSKQNYTMLDNLKLGYGGTKAEMERLLQDAEKYAGYVEGSLNIDSFADVTEAIHIVQEELGITGTTAKEAAQTISGSVAMTKSAWQNLITGLGDENADLDQLIGNLVESASTAADNVIPRVTQILNGMGTAVTKMAPIISAQLPTLIQGVLPSVVQGGATLLMGLVTGLITALPELARAGPPIIATLVTALAAALPDMAAAGGQLLEMLGNGLIQGIPALMVALPDVIAAIFDFLTANLPKWLEMGAQFLAQLGLGIIAAIPELIAKLPQVLASFTEFFTTNFPVILQKGGELLGQLIMGIIGAIPELVLNLPRVIMAIVDTLYQGWSLLRDAGDYLIQGLWAGIQSKIDWVKDKISGFVQSVKDIFTGSDGFDEHSPSRWAGGVGRFLDEGLAGGILGRAKTAWDAAKKLTAGVKEEMELPWDDWEPKPTRGGPWDPAAAGAGIQMNIYVTAEDNDTEKARRYGKILGEETARTLRGKGVV